MTRRRLAPVAALVATVSMATTVCGAASTPPETGITATTTARTIRVRVMTWNLERGQAVAGPLAPAGMAPFAALIAANRADVVGLQEVTREEAEAVSAALGWLGPAYVETKRPCPGFPPPLPGSCIPFGNAVLSRYPMAGAGAEHWALPPSRLEEGLEDRVLLRAIVDADGLRLSVYVTHLAANATQAEREAQAEAVLAHVDDTGPAILLGDLNADPTDDPIARLTARFVDAWTQARDDEPGYTSNAVLGLRRRLDYILVGRESRLRVTEAVVDATVLSDHLPVVAELEATDA